MTPRHPPRLAVLLLKRFAANEPLAGDLHEEYLAGRSSIWYWRQVIAAVVLVPMRRVDLLELFAVQNMFMQFVMLGLTSVCAVFTVKFIAVAIGDDTVVRMLIGPGGVRELFRLAVSFGVAVPVGVAIARVHVRCRRAALLAISTTVPLWAFANVYLLNGDGNLDSVVPHVVALLVFIAGLLSGGLHVDPLVQARHVRHT
jgi:hypothetical protein